MKNCIVLFLLIFNTTRNFAQTEHLRKDSAYIASIYSEILLNGTCYDELRYLCKQIGHRVAGSPSADKAIQWGKSRLEDMGADSSYLMPVEVPHWSRGKNEWGKVHFTKNIETIPVVALGGSVGGHIKGQIIEVKSIKELTELGYEKLKVKLFLLINL